MKSLFNDILKMDGVKGAILFSASGEVRFQEGPIFGESGSDGPWVGFLETLQGIREAELVFEQGKLYIRQTASGFLLLVMDSFVSMAMTRLSCDSLLPALKKMNASKGWMGFFHKK